MVERWEDEFPALPAVVPATAVPAREDVALSVAHKIALVAAVVAIILAMWGMTSTPASSAPQDVTLGPPVAPR